MSGEYTLKKEKVNMGIIRPKQFRVNYSRFTSSESDAGRYRITIPIEVEIKGETLVSEAIVDTGADTTILSSKILGLDYSRERAKGYLRASYPSFGAGGSTFMVDLAAVDGFKFGGMYLKEPFINISFDNSFTVNLIGMDILGMYQILIHPEKRIITFRETNELAKFRPDINPVHRLDDFCKDTVIDFGIEEAEAIAVREMLNAPIIGEGK